MRAGSSLIAVRFSLCVSFRSRTRGLPNIRVCRYWFAAVIGPRQRIRRIKACSATPSATASSLPAVPINPIIESSARVRVVGRNLTRDFTVSFTEDQ
jgi:hypothetical protein